MIEVVTGCCLEVMREIPAGVVDMVFADLPYGRTRNVWDRPLDLAALWLELLRVGHPRTAYVFTAQQPFTTDVIQSNRAHFRYDIVWSKRRVTGFLNAQRQPLRAHETALVFYDKQPIYNPQKTQGHAPVHSIAARKRSPASVYGAQAGTRGAGGSTERYPTSVLEISGFGTSDRRRTNTTQKPDELPAHFIATYTEPGALILDPTCGSGSTLRAAARLGRHAVGIELDPAQAEKARASLESTY